MTQKTNKTRSLEQQFIWLLLATLIPTFALFIAVGVGFNFTLLTWATLGVLLIIIYSSLMVTLYRLVFTPLFSLTSLTEALKIEDYSLRAKSPFSQGIVAQLFDELSSLSQHLQVSKSRYDQHMFLLYGLIEQLKSPVLVLDQHNQLKHANPAVSQLLSVPWQTLKQSPAQKIGLVKRDGFWVFDDEKSANVQLGPKQWQIRQSEFNEGGHTYQLLMLNNISQELQQSEQQAWQDIIRILNHEVRNSLTPISALSQNLLEMPNLSQAQCQQAIKIIDSRSNNLLQFIDSYSDLAKLPLPNLQQFDLSKLLHDIAQLTQEVSHNITAPVMIKADKTQLEQVLLNLIKNAKEAQRPTEHSTQQVETKKTKHIEIKVKTVNQKIIIQVLDQGCGIANPENLFVPFYTTKAKGSGIGLALSRQIVSHHHGELTLANRTDLVALNELGHSEKVLGAVATITLPLL